MRSFSILRTHTGLSTNTKIMVDSQYNMYLESIDSAPELAATRFKKVQFNKNNFIDELVPYFYKDFPVDIAFSIKYDEDSSNMSTDFANQFDDIYSAGARNILDNKNYKEEFEYFAPLYVFKHSLPKYFIIFRVDGPGIVNMTKDNFRLEFLKNLKTVKLFDLTKSTALGEWIDNNFRNNTSFPIAPLEVDFRELEFSKWMGMDYESGGWTYKSFYLDENLENENTLFDFEKLFLDGYRVNKIIFPHILNMSFLYDDTPATPTSLRKWSLNRYSGFYLDDLELIDAITPYTMPELHSDVQIYSGNIISSTNFGDPFVDGYRNDIDMWVEYKGNFYIIKKFEEVIEKSVTAKNVGQKGQKVIIDTVTNPTIVKYRIICDLDLTGLQSLLNNRNCYINDLNQIVLVSNDSPYIINNFEFADVNIVEINGVYHNIQLQNGYLTLITDYGFKFSKKNSFNYYINSGIDGYGFSWDLLISKNNIPKSFKIYRAKFTDVKDFDTNIIDSELSRFEYEKRNSISKTEETKMYLTDLRSKSSPQDFDDFTFNGKTEYIPVASDYTANLETFRISDKKLSDIWRKNPVYCRWGYQNSLSAHDYPYLLNNNDVHENFNRTSDTQGLIPNRPSRNLDYFYTINSGTTSYLHHSLHIEKNNGSIQDTSYRFELDKYLELGTYSFGGVPFSYTFSYFDLFFSQTQSFIDGELNLNRKKYSWFEGGDRVEPNTTLFRGLKFKLYEVDNIKANSTSIENINLFSSNFFQDYKFSILLSSNDWMVSDDNDGTLYKPYHWDYFIDNITSYSGNVGFLTSYSMTPSNINLGDKIEIDQFYPYITPEYQATASNVVNVGGFPSSLGYGFTIDKTFVTTTPEQPGIWRNKMQWVPIKNWEHDKSYQIGDHVLYEDVAFRVIDGSTVSNPLDNPVVLTSNYTIESNFTSFWNYNATYSSTGMTNSWVYRFDEYYYYSSGNINFWNPSLTYSSGSQSLYQNRFYQAYTFSSVPMGIRPVVQNRSIQSSSGYHYWSEIGGTFSSQSNWIKIPLWDKNLSFYPADSFVVHQDVLYHTSVILPTQDIPGQSINWNRVYSFVPDSSYKYSPIDNPLIKINDTFYYCSYNPGQLTLDSGITVYINKKWKNVLVNISINDNTISSDAIIMDETKNIERDHLYVETNRRLTTANFIRQLNDLDTLYGFADHTSYVVIEEDGSFMKYKFGNGIENVPYFLVCEEPDELKLKNNSLKYTINTIDKNTLKPSRFLVNGQIDNLEKIDFYNDVPLGTEIVNIKEDLRILPNLNNQKSEIYQKIFRHSGYYMPIFYEVELFTDASLYDIGSLCEAQFVLWLGTSSISSTQSVTLRMVDGISYIEMDVDIVLPADDSFEEISDFYEQIENIIISNGIFNDKNIIFDIYEPGNSNIHVQISPGYYVLSIKYESDVCDLQLSATQPTVCKSFLEYFFTEINYSYVDLLTYLTSGFDRSLNFDNFCCTGCGPEAISYLQKGSTTPFKAFLEVLDPEDLCNVSATASRFGGSAPAYVNFENWCNDTSQHGGLTVSINNTPAFIADYIQLNTFYSTSTFGVGQHGDNLLSEFVDLIPNITSDQALFIDTLLSNGLVYWCDLDGYHISGIDTYISNL